MPTLDTLIHKLQALISKHSSAGDPHTGYRLKSANHTHQSSGIEAGQLDHGLALTGLIDDDHTQYVTKALFGENTILKANTDDTPIELTVAEQTLIGRITSGVISALTINQIWTLLSNYAGMYRYNNAEPTIIQAIDDWHMVNGFLEGFSGGGWVFHAGEQLAITAYATSDGGTKTQVTCALHGLENGYIISISSTTNYNGVWQVEQVAENTFVINTPYVADDGASVGEHGSGYNSQNATSAGKYLVSYSMSISTATKDRAIETALFCGPALIEKSVNNTFMEKVGTDYQNIAGQTILDIGVNEFINLGIRSTGLKSDSFTLLHANVTLTRIG